MLATRLVPTRALRVALARRPPCTRPRALPHALPSAATHAATLSTSVAAAATHAPAAPPPIVHDPHAHMFAATLPDGDKAVLRYRPTTVDGQAGIDIWQTYTPPSARGMGLASKLADAALEWAGSVAAAPGGGLPVVVTCAYVRDTYLPAGKAARWRYAVAGGSDKGGPVVLRRQQLA
jgi:predicted GNAT family acetyltransferase